MKRSLLVIFLFCVCAGAQAEKKPVKSATVQATEALEEAYRQNSVEALDAWTVAWPKAPKMLRDKAKTLRARIGKAEQMRLDSLDEEKWQNAHRQATQSANGYALQAFGRGIGYLFHSAERQHDDSVCALIAAYRQGKASEQEIIATTAPYYIAYRMLLRYLAPELGKSQWTAAREKALGFASNFGDDPCYRDLLRVLAQGERETKEAVVPADVAGQMYDPNLTADGRMLYFCGQNLENSLAADNEDIFLLSRKADGWGMPEAVSSLNAPETEDAIESVSPDGTQIVVFVEGRTYISQKTADGWGKMRSFSDSVNILGDWVGDVRIAADGKTAFLTSRRMTDSALDPDIFGGSPTTYDMDIYITQRGADGKWRRPLALPPTINSPFCERAAFLHPDMRTLYFTSNGHSTIGGFDLFRSIRLNPESWTEWSTPENIGTIVNTTGDEEFFSVSTDGRTLYLSSGAHGRERLYALAMPADMRPEEVATIEGRLLTDEGEVLGAPIRWEDLTTGQALGVQHADPQDGHYFLTLPLGHRYGYYIDEQGYLPVSDHIDLREVTTARHIEKDIRVTPLLCANCDSSVMKVSNLFFAVDRADILPESLPELRRLAALLKSSGLRAEIAGHADNTGNQTHNQQLSQQRAEAVMHFLIAEGCDAAMLRAVGYGDKRPVASNATEEGRQANRRVELIFKRK